MPEKKEEKVDKDTKEKEVDSPIQKEVLDEELLDEDLEKEIQKAMSGGKSKYIIAVGRRKTATARIRLFTQGKKGIIINDKLYTDYFPTKELQRTIEDPLERLKCKDKFAVTVKVSGGGPTGQAEAVRHGISRALVSLNPYFKKRLKKTGLLTRDPRMRERKKPGLKRARRAPQWSKR